MVMEYVSGGELFDYIVKNGKVRLYFIKNMKSGYNNLWLHAKS
jgi:serine/threonine protein kinase